MVEHGSSNPRIIMTPKVLLSGVLFPSTPAAKLLNLILEGVNIHVVDSILNEEYELILLHPSLGLPHGRSRDFLNKLASLAEFVVPVPLPFRMKEYYGVDYHLHSLSFSAGCIPVIKPALHYFLGEQGGMIPVYTPEGFLKYEGYFA
ncbi:MAG: hypothetical protein JW971_03195 [Synergistales bacterium]|nr:hypothetical protein [Synergistales bacterium]